MYIIPLVAFLAARGRDYYLSPGYPMLLAAGAVWGERWLTSLQPRVAGAVVRATWNSLVISGLVVVSGRPGCTREFRLVACSRCRK